MCSSDLRLRQRGLGAMAGLEAARMEIERRSLLQHIACVAPGDEEHGTSLRNIDDRKVLTCQGTAQIGGQCRFAAGRADDPHYEVYVTISFADYLWNWLERAADEYGLAVIAA